MRQSEVFTFGPPALPQFLAQTQKHLPTLLTEPEQIMDRWIHAKDQRSSIEIIIMHNVYIFLFKIKKIKFNVIVIFICKIQCCISQLGLLSGDFYSSLRLLRCFSWEKDLNLRNLVFKFQKEFSIMSQLHNQNSREVSAVHNICEHFPDSTRTS